MRNESTYLVVKVWNAARVLGQQLVLALGLAAGSLLFPVQSESIYFNNNIP